MQLDDVLLDLFVDELVRKEDVGGLVELDLVLLQLLYLLWGQTDHEGHQVELYVVDYSCLHGLDVRLDPILDLLVESKLLQFFFLAVV